MTLWLRDAGEDPASPGWARRFDRWVDWFRRRGVPAIGIGIVTLRQTDRPPVVVCEDVPQLWDGPAGPAIAGWLARTSWLAARDDAQLLATAFAVADDVELLRSGGSGPDGWRVDARTLAQRGGLRFEVPTDEPVAAVLAGCDGQRPLGLLAAVLAASSGWPSDAVAAAVCDPVRDLVRRGLLLPRGGADG